jgi:hypothetical protein
VVSCPCWSRRASARQRGSRVSRRCRHAAARSSPLASESSAMIATTSAAFRAPTVGPPSSSARASRGCTPTRDIRCPRGVARPSLSTAPSACSVVRATRIAASGGGSGNASPLPSGCPQQARARAKPVSSATATSGSGCAGSRSSSYVDQHRYTTPGPSRPARPARWTVLALAARTVARDARPRAWSVRGTRASPESTTTRTPGTVRLLSATAEASTTRRCGRCRSAASWSNAVSRPCRTSIGRPARRRCTEAISPAPGRNTNRSPSFSRHALRTTAATWSRNAGSTFSPCGGLTGRSGGHQNTVTSCRAPCAVTIPASSNSPNRSASAVAEVARSRRSGRSVCLLSTRNASARSVSRCRSWHSSIMTVPTPASSGSARSRCTRSPVVTTSIRVPGPTLRSPRTL